MRCKDQAVAKLGGIQQLDIVRERVDVGIEALEVGFALCRRCVRDGMDRTCNQ